MTCLSASQCWAVGYYYNNGSGHNETLIEEWNGTSWVIVASPNNGTVNNILQSVTCTSASQCWAVGSYSNGSSDQTLIEQWNGNSWSIIASPNTSAAQNNDLYGVACASASQCWAVGNYVNGSSVSQTLIEQWNGTSWTIVTSPNNGGATQYNFLTAVTCASASQCWAVGYYDGIETLIEQWNGTSWSIVTSPNAAGTNHLYGVTCASASQCWAVGYHLGSAYQTLIEEWNGTSWTIVTSPSTSTTQNNYLYGVTCASASQCWAIGYYVSGSGANQTITEQWNGSSWAIVNSPNTSTTQSSSLSGVTCASASQCWTVGEYSDGGTNLALLEEWNGSNWSIVNSASSDTEDNILYGVTCVSGSDCWAVGFYTNVAGFNQTLIEQWSGSDWSIVPSLNSGGAQYNYLNGVACPSASQCWAVGSYSNGSSDQTLIEQWNGNSWSIIASPNTSAAQNNDLYGVACASASQCWAVGYYDNGSLIGQTLIEQWNGTSWVIVASPNNGTGSNQLAAVTCTSASQCWAVGNYVDGSGYDQTLIEQWNGTSWAIVTSPNTSASQHNVLSSVACPSASQCWAVGHYYNGSADQTLIEQWNGSSWAIVTSSNNGTQFNDLYGVTCTSVSQCWAIGSYNNGSSTLIEQWNGTSWAIVTSSNNGTQSNDLYGVTCTSVSQCWAVGNGNGQTLIEQYTASLLTITSVSRPADGHFVITGQGEPLSSINIQASPDLVTTFTNLGTATSDANGIFQYDDAGAIGLSKRFYRATYP